MRRVMLAVLVAVLAAGSALAQTDTPTLTPTLTPTATVTATATRTGTRAPICTSDFCAFHYGSFKADASTSPTIFTRTIIGIKPGDLIVLYPLTTTCFATVNTIINNAITFIVTCGSDVPEQDVEYVWFSRTQNNCQGADNCRRAFTVTPTPAP